MSKGNGKVKRKNGRPKAGEGVSQKLIKVEAIKHDGSPVAVGKALGISPQAADKHLDKPDIQKAVLDARERALKKAGITLEKVFGKVGTNLRKKGGPDQRHAIDKSLLLLGEETSEPPAGVKIIMPLIVINGQQMKYNLFDNGNPGPGTP